MRETHFFPWCLHSLYGVIFLYLPLTSWETSSHALPHKLTAHFCSSPSLLPPTIAVFSSIISLLTHCSELWVISMVMHRSSFIPDWFLTHSFCSSCSSNENLGYFPNTVISHPLSSLSRPSPSLTALKGFQILHRHFWCLVLPPDHRTFTVFHISSFNKL